MLFRIHILLILLSVAASFSLPAVAQPGFKPNIKKEKPYEERILKAEKTGEGKLKTHKRVMQNLTTRFNYYFNAQNKLNDVVDRAKSQHREDYSQLLPFYNFSLATTAADSLQLDSIIYKARTGIINHDLRNEWIDELYLLWGAAYHLQNQLDSAALMFQFINYSFAPQEEDGFYRYIGTRVEGAQELTIATVEKKQLLHSNTFSRNNAFIWQIRTLTEAGDLTRAGSLITTLKRDPAFPKRLINALAEAEAYWWYKQQRWDSAAKYLTKAIDGAGVRLERARWYYLIAQLMERTGQSGQAGEFYNKAITSTPDPVMEVYSRLNLVRINKEGGEGAIDKNLEELLKMAKRDKYEEYRDVIYYMAAQIELERGNTAAALALLLKGAQYNNGNSTARSKAFLRLADAAYDGRKYLQSASFYDSIQVADLLPPDAQRVDERKMALQKIVFNSYVVMRQDSLQRIAALPEAERDDYIKKLVKRLRREQGLKDEAAPSAGGISITSTAPTDLFGGQKGEWYFYNNTLRTQGAAQFKQAWGTRPNVDNWRRFAVVSKQLLAGNPMNTRGGKDGTGQPVIVPAQELTVEGMMSGLPLLPEKIKASNDSIRTALFALGTAYLNELEDYASAIETFEELRRRFPDGDRMEQVLFNLYYAYTKTGTASAAAAIKKLLQDRYPSSRSTAIATTGKDPAPSAKTPSPESTRAYENVYNLYIEGRFEEAQTAKRIADSTYRTTFWQPQLLYIEAVYNIKQRNDSIAANVLQTIVRQNTNTALTDKAQNLLSVLSRRRQIENELTAYQIQKQPTDSTAQQPVVVNTPVIKKDTTAAQPVAVTAPKDTVKKIPVVKPVDTAAKQPVVAKKTDTVAKKPVATNVKDSVVKKPVVKRTDTLVKNPVAKPVDTVVKKAPPKPASLYNFVPDAPHYAVIFLDKVDPVFVGEARNAFSRFNKEKAFTQSLDVQNVPLNGDAKMLLIGTFASAQEATDYASRTKALAPSEIIPWLTANKYSISIISAANLEALKGAQDINAYKKFLDQYLPGRF